MKKQPLEPYADLTTSKKVSHNIQVGRWGEDLATNYLKNKGYEILDRNVHTPYGELDIICSKNGMIIFVEVKTRTNIELGYPEAGLTKVKISHLIQACEEYLMLHPNLPEEWSIDLIAIIGKPGISYPNIEHFENVANG